jgi:hypothetical protein
LNWLKWTAGASAAIGSAAVLATHLMSDDPSIGSLLFGFVLVFVAVLLGTCLLALVFHTVPRRWRPLLLAATLLPALAAAGALGLPGSAIHYSDDGEWAIRAGREISLAALVLGGLIAAAVARRHSYSLVATAGVALLTFALAAVGRDLVARDQEPLWCYADHVEADAQGGVEASGEYDGCTVLLPARDV